MSARFHMTMPPDDLWLHIRRHAMTPLRQRMTEDMQLRGLAPTTQQAYLRYVEQLALFIGKSPDLVCVAASNSAYAGKDVRTSFFTALKSAGAGRPDSTWQSGRRPQSPPVCRGRRADPWGLQPDAG